MSMLLRSRSRCLWGLGLACVGLTLMLGAGCSGRPENSPVVRKKFQELAELQDQMGNLSVQVKQMSAEMAAVRKDLADLIATKGTDALAKTDSTATQETAAAQPAATTETATAPAAEPAAETAAAPKKEVAAAETVKAPASPKSSGLGSATSSKSKGSDSASSAKSSPERKSAPSAPPKPRGKYYTIQSGDTPASIARKNGISTESLLRANRLPSDATVFPGQKLYVPAGN